MVEIEGEGQTQQSVPLGEADDQAFEDVILAQDTTPKTQQEEEEISKKSISNYLNEIKDNYEDAKLISLVIQQIKELIEIDNNLNAKIGDIEAQVKKESAEREKLAKKIDKHYLEVKELAKNMDKFVALYELVTNQFNPFLENQEKLEPMKKADDGGAEEENKEDLSESEKAFQKYKQEGEDKGSPQETSQNSEGSGQQNPPAQTHQEEPKEEEQQETKTPETAGKDVAQDAVGSHSQGMPEVAQKEAASTAAQDEDSNPKNKEVDLSYHPEPQKKTKVLPDHLHFQLKDGSTIDSLSSLLKFFKESDDATIAEYVTHYKNDFSAWIYHTFHNEHLSKVLSEGKTREELIKILEEYIRTH